MNAGQYTMVAYVIVGVLMWGYAAHLFWVGRSLKRREMRTGEKP